MEAEQALRHKLTANDGDSSPTAADTDVVASSATTTDAWTQMVMNGIKRMAVDENYRRQVMSFREPDSRTAPKRIFH